MEPSWWMVLEIAALTLSVSSLVMVILFTRYIKQLEKDWTAAMQPLERDLRALCTTASRAGDRLLKVEQETRKLMERQDQVEMRAPTTGHFQHAIALVQRGASTEDLVANCGLARGEAELLHLLHRSQA